MFGSLNYGVGNINCELAGAGGNLPPPTVAVSTTASAGQNDSTGGVSSQIVGQALGEVMSEATTGSCYQQLSNSYGTPSLQFLQQHTLQQMYNNPQQVYNMVTPAGGLQLQMGTQVLVSNVQGQTQSHQVHHTQTQGQQLLGLAEQFLMDDATTAATNHFVGSNANEFGISLSLSKGNTSPTQDKIQKGSGTPHQCNLCRREFKKRSLLRKHVALMHEGYSPGQSTQTGPTQQRPVPVHSRLWCVEAECEFQSENCGKLALHLEESHGKRLEKMNVRLSSLREFFKWKNNLEETSRVKFILTSGSIVRTQPDSANFIFECHRSAALGAQHRLKQKHMGENKLDVMEKAVQEILPTNLSVPESQEEEIYLLDIIEENLKEFQDLDETSVRKGRNRTSGSAVILGVPCCAYIEIQVSLISGAVVATGCISHAGHDPEEKIFRPPDCVLGKLKGMIEAGHSKDELSAGLMTWTKHHLSDGSWKLLDSMSSTNSDLFLHIRALVRKIFEHVSVITRLTSEHYWVDFMETLAELFEVERRIGTIRKTMDAKLKDTGGAHEGRAKELAALETELCYFVLCYGTDRHQLRKFLKYGQDYAADCRLGDIRYRAQFSNVLETPIYDPSAALFKHNTELSATADRLQKFGDYSQKKKTTRASKNIYHRKLIGSDDDSEYNCWSDEELEDVIPRRWPQPTPSKPLSTLEEKRLEKNLKRKQVPVLNVDPILKEKILAMRVMAANAYDDNAKKDVQEKISAGVLRKRGRTKRESTSNAQNAKNKLHARKGKNTKIVGGKRLKAKQKYQKKRQNHCASNSNERDAQRGENKAGEEKDSKEPIESSKGCGKSSSIGYRRKKPKALTNAKVAISNEDNCEQTDEVTEDNMVPAPIVIREIKMDGPSGKKPRIVKILATEPGQSIDQATIVVEAPPQTPQPGHIEGSTAKEVAINADNAKRTPMVSLLRQDANLFTGGRSLLKPMPTISLLKPRERLFSSPNKTNSIQTKSSLTHALPNGDNFFERELLQNFDESALQIPQLHRIIDE
ncbi:uncharacterized protein LOC111247545 isoform X2 [Varroa destructor]|nr:uncharacterized protein LOC111247545 isoform X2 [Varroa destructor]XP_022654322.1 uncharacterized protein LOC111247545 isoform X2 [Varroa destructor]